MAGMTRKEQKAMFAKFAEKDSNLRKQQLQELEELKQKHPKEFGFKEDRRISDLREKIRGTPLNLGVIISNAKKDPKSFTSDDTSWLFVPKRYQVTDIPNRNVWKEFPLKIVRAKFIRDINSGEKIINIVDDEVNLFVVNNTRVHPEKLREIAQFARTQGLLKEGTVKELRDKAIFDAVDRGNFVNSPESTLPISIKLGNSTFILAPFIGGGETSE